LFHLGDRLRYGVSIMAPRGLQISSPNQFGDHFTGSYPEGGLNDLVHGVKVQVTGRLRRCRAIKRRSSARSALQASPWLEHCHSLKRELASQADKTRKMS
jgi:hypothetical protein